MTTWFTADTHFGDHRATNISKRPFGSVAEMDAALVERWNAAIAPGDAGAAAQGFPPRHARRAAGIQTPATAFLRANRNRRMNVAIFNKDMVELATRNEFWQKEVYLDKKVQVVLMSIPAGEEIGMETHPADQTTFIVAGTAQVTIDGHDTKAGPNHMVIVPKGSQHNIVNKGGEPLKLFSVYAPPAEPEGAAFRTKEEAEEAEKGLLARAKDKIGDLVGGKD